MSQTPRLNKVVLSILALLRRAGVLLVFGFASVMARAADYILSEIIA
ncbi:MAG: hypothetical protein ACYC7D_13470 [Nitrososphaerales archaeon]